MKANMGRRSATQSDVSGGGGHGRSHRSGRTTTTMAREGQSGGERERKGERRFAKVS